MPPAHRFASTTGWRRGTEVQSAVGRSYKTYYVKHDERWRIVGVFRESDTSAKEAFVYHNAGNGGYGGSSYIDDCILRDRDHNSGWTSAADGTLEQRRYYCQNWRHDVVALIKSDGKIAERDRYLSYGRPFGSPLADATFDGAVDGSDTTQVNSDWGANYHVRSDFDLSGTVGAADLAEVTANNGKTLGWGALSDITNVASRKGYAGYEIDIAISKLYHVRHRVLHMELGRWMRRDYLGYVDGPSLYTYCTSQPQATTDPTGAITAIPCANQQNPIQGPGITQPIFSPNTPLQCCQVYFRQNRRHTTTTICCCGNLVSCIKEEWAPANFPWPGVAPIIVTCQTQSELLHCNNASCTGVITGDPVWPGMPMSCSECVVYSNMVDCLVSSCGFNSDHCIACNGNVDCENKMKALIDGAIAIRDSQCQMCFQAWNGGNVQ